MGTWVLAKEKRHRRWEREPDCRCHPRAPLTQYHMVGVPHSSSPFSCSLGLILISWWLAGGAAAGAKLVACPLSHLLLAVFQELQIHLSSPNPQVRQLLTHSATWGKSLLSGPQSPQKSKMELNQRSPVALNLCIPEFPERMSEEALPHGYFPVDGDGGRKFGDFP